MPLPGWPRPRIPARPTEPSLRFACRTRRPCAQTGPPAVRFPPRRPLGGLESPLAAIGCRKSVRLLKDCGPLADTQPKGPSRLSQPHFRAQKDLVNVARFACRPFLSRPRHRSRHRQHAGLRTRRGACLFRAERCRHRGQKRRRRPARSGCWSCRQRNAGSHARLDSRHSPHQGWGDRRLRDYRGHASLLHSARTQSTCAGAAPDRDLCSSVHYER